MRMGTAQKQNISVQHRIWNQNKRPRVMTCEEWRDYRFNQLKSDGVKIEHGHCGPAEAWRLTNTKAGTVMIVPQSEIEADWKRCYLHRGVKA